jgi:hypothetical protein
MKNNKTYLDELDFGEDNGLNLYDPTNPDIQLFNLVDEEQVKLAGSKLHIYKYNRTENFDSVYMEEQNKTISPLPITVWGSYEPKVIEQKLSQFGIEQENDQLFTFNKSYVTQKLGRAPIAGDIIKPDFEANKYEVFEVQEEAFNNYGVFHYLCHAKLLRDSPEIVDLQEPMRDQTNNPVRDY